jgi:hypothetical protein
MKRNIDILKIAMVLIFALGTSASFAQTNWKLTGNDGCASCTLGTNDANDIDFVTDGVVRATIQPTSGNMGVGVLSPAVKLHVDGGTDSEPGSGGFLVLGATSAANISFDNNEIMARNAGAAASLFLQNDGGDLQVNNQALVVKSTKLVGIGTTAPVVELHEFHGSGSGSTHGLRIQHSGTNGNFWTLYTENSIGDLDLNFKGVNKGRFDDVSGAYTALSDARFKKDVEKASPIMNNVMKLDVKKYHFLENQSTDLKYYGMIAQEVEKVFPEVVHHVTLDDGTDEYTMDYSAFGVIAIKAIQEQQATIVEKNKQLNDLQSQLNELKIALVEKGILSSEEATAAKTTTVSLSEARLEQNAPNPFSATTTIKYFIPEGSGSAQISFVDQNGKALKVLKISQIGEGQVVLNAFELPAGMYTYVLTVDGRTIEAKQMQLTR